MKKTNISERFQRFGFRRLQRLGLLIGGIAMFVSSYKNYFDTNWFNIIDYFAIAIGAIICFGAAFMERREEKIK